MDASLAFKLPSLVPQDLHLIRDLIGEVPVPTVLTEISTTSKPSLQDNPINSSDSDSDSDTASDTDSDADSEQEVEATILGAVDDEDDRVSPNFKNEIIEADVVIPDISEVEPDETLEKVGEVMSIIDKVVIVKGLASGIANRGSEKALDSDTLLVFEDRKVLGYIYETFGPTSEPLYQVKFNHIYPLDSDKIKVSRAVFHVPQRSHYVFVNQLKQLKGSDASNVHDEEPAEDELEFSDDEQEAAHKRQVAERRERYRSQSVASSRHSTPTPSHMRDQDIADESYSNEPNSFNDMDFGAGPSRPAPIPYDDPYSDMYGVPDLPPALSPTSSEVKRDSDKQNDIGSHPRPDRGRGRGRGKGRGASGRREDRGRGRGRDRRHSDRGRGWGHDQGGHDRSGSWADNDHSQTHPDQYDSRARRSLSPTSLAIARATGQYADGTVLGPETQTAPSPTYQQVADGGWDYSQYPMQPYGFSLAGMSDHTLT
ncbi:H/ACA ribonucleoprotein complex non-core subunit NAF1 [Grifola frondosa]|uniref:H/ACA ribonucleoprotein complex non-core subunit NAF1 n=1 Tax=Grifola frondosa TaxID=5627 RepID=A0A1C7MWT6_GRIFR|nr:H/ACA ribonucleoprotein complex non-core subunit NAF1 [Grifola frondosa]